MQVAERCHSNVLLRLMRPEESAQASKWRPPSPQPTAEVNGHACSTVRVIEFCTVCSIANSLKLPKNMRRGPSMSLMIEGGYAHKSLHHSVSAMRHILRGLGLGAKEATLACKISMLLDARMLRVYSEKVKCICKGRTDGCARPM